MKKIVFATLLSVVSISIALAQPSERRFSKNEYIEMYKDDAIREMHISGVPASITLAQGILESNSGNSPLARYGKNHFGIKCHGWEGPSMKLDDDKKNECFRKYNTVYESYRDHSEFLSNRGRYSFLFNLKPTDYKGWAKGLKKAGYATNPKYPDLLITLIEENDLQQYDRIKRMPKIDPSKNKPKKNPVVLSHVKREIKVHDNNIKYAIAKPGDTYYKIAKDFDMGLWQIKKYNDLNKKDEIKAGDIIYLQPKRRKASTKKHKVEKGETVRDISQKYGIKIKRIYKLNNLEKGAELKNGQKLKLR